MSLQVDPNNPGHLWSGMDNTAPPGTTIASDTIGLVQQNINMIPDKSWVVQLFELFTEGMAGGTAELDLISEYTGKTRFVAIFMGNNIHYFMIPAVVGHLYRRTVMFDRGTGHVLYVLNDVSTGMSETFPFTLPPGPDYTITSVSRGIEWHNLQETTTFPVDWVVALSPSISFSSPAPSNSQQQQMPVQPLSSGILLLGGIILGAFLLWGLLSSF